MLNLFNSLFGRYSENIKANVEIYTWATCPYCIRAKWLLGWKGVKYTEYKIDGDETARKAMSERANGKRSVPQIFINNDYIGGCDDFYKLDSLGETRSPFGEIECLKMENYLSATDEKTYLSHRQWMRAALELAREAGEWGDVPVGAIVIDKGGNLIAKAANSKEKDQDPTAHAEILALRAASQALGNWHLTDCTLYVTLEPCPMCAGAIIHARLRLLVYGTDDPKTGVIRTVANFPDSPFSNHRLPVIAGILESDCRQILQTWFERKRTLKS